MKVSIWLFFVAAGSRVTDALVPPATRTRTTTTLSATSLRQPFTKYRNSIERPKRRVPKDWSTELPMLAHNNHRENFLTTAVSNFIRRLVLSPVGDAVIKAYERDLDYNKQLLHK